MFSKFVKGSKMNTQKYKIKNLILFILLCRSVINIFRLNLRFLLPVRLKICLVSFYELKCIYIVKITFSLNSLMLLLIITIKSKTNCVVEDYVKGLK